MGTEALSQPDNEGFAHRLRLAMRQAGHETDAEIKAALREWFDVSLEAVRTWLTGDSLPRTKRIFDIASRCQVRGEWLARGEGSPEIPQGQLDQFKPYKEVRSDNLRQWINDDPVANGNISAWCDHYSARLPEGESPFSPSHVSQCLSPRERPTRNIGDRFARKIEQAMGRPLGDLDRDRDEIHTPATSMTSALERALYAATPVQMAMIDVLLGIEPRAQLPSEAQDLLRMAARLAQTSAVDKKE